MHLGLGGAALAASRWTGWASDLVLAVILAKIFVVVLAALLGRRARRVKASKARR